MPNWKKILVSGSDASLNSLVVTNGITGSLFGTASFAISSSRAISSSFATTASYSIYAQTASFSDRTVQIDVYVKNLSGAQINKGSVVRIIGAVGDNPLIATASYTDDNNSANTLGITTQNIPNDDFGYVITEGILIGINTSLYTAGQLLYLGATGSITGSAPIAPLHAVRLGEVLRSHAVVGSMYVRIDNGYELGELHDVRDTSTTSSYGDLLVKSGSLWINSKQLTGSYGLTGSLNATSFTGSLLGTASFATSALSASFSTTALSSSFATTASFVGNSLITASVSSNTITFTKGNGTTFPITVATGSAAPAFPFTGSAGITGSLAVVGPVSASAVYISGSGTQRLIVVGSGSASPIFTVQGSQGELFSVTDSLSGSLFSVNDISGLPILEVFSDNTTTIGDYLAPMLVTTKRVTQTNSGSFIVYSIPTSSYGGAFIDYTIKSGSNARAGTIMSTWAGSSIEFTEVDTMDIGNTTAVGLTMILSGSNAVLTGSSSTGAWTIKTIIRTI